MYCKLLLVHTIHTANAALNVHVLQTILSSWPSILPSMYCKTLLVLVLKLTSVLRCAKCSEECGGGGEEEVTEGAKCTSNLTVTSTLGASSMQNVRGLHSTCKVIDEVFNLFLRIHSTVRVCECGAGVLCECGAGVLCECGAGVFFSPGGGCCPVESSTTCEEWSRVARGLRESLPQHSDRSPQHR